MARLGVLASFGLLLAIASETATAQSCCARLQQRFPQRTYAATSNAPRDVVDTVEGVVEETLDLVETVTNSLYESLVLNRWSETAICTPACVFQPATPLEVAAAVKILSQNSCKFAVKSGGHMPIPGANSINGGVSIDLGALNHTRLADDRSYVSLGAGGTWGDAYLAFESEGIAFPGGVCGTTGVGGVSLGGGESLFQPRVGWVVDNVLNYEVVLADGSVVNANETHLPDLFKALKGGSGNFGIVTSVDIAAFEQPSIWAGQIVVPDIPTTRAQALSITTNFTEANNDDPNAGLQMAFIKFANGTNLIDFGIAATDGNPDSPMLKPYTQVQPQILNTVHSRTLANAILEFDSVLPAGYRQIGASVTFVNGLDSITAVQDAFDAVHATIADIPDLDWIIFYNPQPAVIETFSAARGGNVLGLQNSTNDQIVTLLVPRWLDAQYDARVYQAAHDWVAAANNATAAVGKFHPFLYLNFALGDQKPFCTYGRQNVNFLQATARKYDPTGVFQRLVPGGFKVFAQC